MSTVPTRGQLAALKIVARDGALLIDSFRMYGHHVEISDKDIIHTVHAGTWKAIIKRGWMDKLPSRMPRGIDSLQAVYRISDSGLVLVRAAETAEKKFQEQFPRRGKTV